MTGPTLLLGHGASGTARSMLPWITALATHRVTGVALDLPKANATRAMEVFQQGLAVTPDAAIGGHSYGGRVASMVAAAQRVPALVLLSYPLHRPGHPDELRTEHWARIACPVLLLSGDRDPFAKLALLRREVAKLRAGELVVYPGLRHGLLAVKDDAAERIATFLQAR